MKTGEATNDDPRFRRSDCRGDCGSDCLTCIRKSQGLDDMVEIYNWAQARANPRWEEHNQMAMKQWADITEAPFEVRCKECDKTVKVGYRIRIEVDGLYVNFTCSNGHRHITKGEER